MSRRERRGPPALLEDAEVGEIVRCDVGLVRVGPRIAGEHFCRLVAPHGDDFRDISEPLHLAGRTRVLELVRDLGHYLRHRRAGGAPVVDPLQGGTT